LPFFGIYRIFQICKIGSQLKFFICSE